MLPDDVEWPTFEGCIPLRFVAELDCVALAAAGGVESMPSERYFGPGARAAIDRHMEFVMRCQKVPVSDEYPLWASDFELGIAERRCYAQSGGHPYEVQRPPEIEAARRAASRRDCGPRR